METGVRGGDTEWAGPTLLWWSHMGRDVSAAEDPPVKLGVSAPYQVPQPRVPVLGREVSITYGCENHYGLWLSKKEGFWSLRCFS